MDATSSHNGMSQITLDRVIEVVRDAAECGGLRSRAARSTGMSAVTARVLPALPRPDRGSEHDLP